MWNTVQQSLAYLLNSHVCPLCRSPLEATQALCVSCEHSLPWHLQACPGCGEAGHAQRCPRCLQKPPPWQTLHVPFAYAGPIRQALIELKFQHRFDRGRWLAVLLAQSLQHRDSALPAIIVPMPIHPTRLHERGFNQAFELARLLSQEIHTPCRDDLLIRQRNTPHQTGLNLKQRQRNLRQAFIASPATQGLNVALLDDIITSGTTARAATQTLLNAGAESVEVWAIARTPKAKI